MVRHRFSIRHLPILDLCDYLYTTMRLLYESRESDTGGFEGIDQAAIIVLHIVRRTRGISALFETGTGICHWAEDLLQIQDIPCSSSTQTSRDSRDSESSTPHVLRTTAPKSEDSQLIHIAWQAENHQNTNLVSRRHGDPGVSYRRNITSPGHLSS